MQGDQPTYEIASWWEKLTADYMRISLLEVEELDYLAYLQYRRDAFIHRLNETEAGRDYLSSAFRLQQTSMTKNDRSRLKEMFGKGLAGNGG